MLSTQPYKGTRDFYPEDMAIRQWMFDRLRQVLKGFGYLEYDGPMLEPFELYASKTSEEIVNEQLYWMMDRGERKIAVRPEMTPTLARMVAGKQNELPKPIRWFSIPNLWRYERPQRGRLREHWQLNVDVFGGEPLPEDTEICLVIASIMEGFGAKQGYEVRLNHRGLTNAFFTKVLKLDSEERIATIGRLLDAAPKMGKDAYIEALKKEGLSSSQIQSLTHILEKDAATWLKKELGEEPCLMHLNLLLERMQTLGIGSVFRFDPSIMRGFLYYTGTVFETYDLHPENSRALFGGGRYDDLVGMFGGQKLPGVGFGMGDVTLRNFLEVHKLIPNLSAPKGIYISYLDAKVEAQAFKLSQELRSFAREKNIIDTFPVLMGLHAEKPKKAFSSAEKLHAKHILFVGEEEAKTGRFTAKNLATKEQVDGTSKEIFGKLI